MDAYLGYRIHSYGSYYIDPLKFGTWVLTREWALAWALRYMHTYQYTHCNLPRNPLLIIITNWLCSVDKS